MRDNGRETADGGHIYARTQNELAKEIGCQPTTASKYLRLLEQQGRIQRDSAAAWIIPPDTRKPARPPLRLVQPLHPAGTATAASDTTDNDLQDLAETVTQLAKHLRAAAHRSEDDYLYLSIDAAYITAATALAAHTTKTSQTDQ